MSDIKVTDRRMFTPDGRLREEYRDESATDDEPGREGRSEASPLRESEPEPEPPPRAAADVDAADLGRGPSLEIPTASSALAAPGFFDLVGALAEPASIYLGDVPMPDGASAENLEAARFHIDLLDLLRKRTAGNLSAQEHAVLEDVIYRLRLRYVQKRG